MPETRILEEVLDAAYKCDAASEKQMRRLSQLGGFPSDNLIARLAIGRSLLVALPAELDVTQTDGKEIKGRTLLGRLGPAGLLASMIAVHAGRPLSSDDLRQLIKFHWERGLTLMEGDLDTGGDAFDALLVRYASESVLSDEEVEGEPREREDLFDSLIVGQDEAKRMVRRLVREAHESTPPMLRDSIMFTGPASTGKTLFAETIAEALRLPHIETTGASIQSLSELFDQIDAALDERGQPPSPRGTRSGLPFLIYPPLIVFVDECHQLPKKVQDELLTMTEATKRTAMLPNFVADMGNATVILATTDSARLTKPLRTRFREVRLDPYTRDEVAEIVGRVHRSWSLEVRRLIAMAGRMTPRLAKQRGKDLQRILDQDYDGARPSEAILRQVMTEEWEVDANGLTPRDHTYLGILAKAHSPVGLSTLAGRLSVEQSEVEEAIEPFLLSLGIAEKTSRGRVLTRQGKELVNVED